ncbi:MAG TPA: C40 family peptidase [Steroidobacteraceae bacterium]|nr:C40 family peptidase [Steroidobacteraceae bacterium]
MCAPHATRARRLVPLLAAVLLLGACATEPRRAALQPNAGVAIAALAVSLVGSPYEFGGADAGGFDCSGLALYVHEHVGLAIPRTAREQQRAARLIARDDLAPGDLVFFRIHSHRVDHVGIYVGSGRFIHAPRAGGAVEYADLGGAYYRGRFAGAGRFWDDGARAGAPPDAPR